MKKAVYVLAIVELLIAYLLGVVTEKLLPTVQQYFIVFGILGVVLTIAYFIVPMLSANFEKEDRSLSQSLIRWADCVLLLVINFPLLWVFNSVVWWKGMLCIFLIVTNILLICGTVVYRKLKAHTKFVYKLATMAKSDPKGAAKYFATNPDVLEALIETLPGGFVLQLGLSHLKDQILEMKAKNDNKITEADAEKIAEQLQKINNKNDVQKGVNNELRK